MLRHKQEKLMQILHGAQAAVHNLCRVYLQDSRSMQWELSVSPQNLWRMIWRRSRAISALSATPTHPSSLSSAALPWALQLKGVWWFQSRTLCKLLCPHTDSTGPSTVKLLSMQIQMSLSVILIFSVGRVKKTDSTRLCEQLRLRKQKRDDGCAPRLLDPKCIYHLIILKPSFTPHPSTK